VHDFERRGMDGVAAKVAQKIRVLLEHAHRDAGAREEQGQHYAGGSAARDAAARGYACASRIIDIAAHVITASIAMSASLAFASARTPMARGLRRKSLRGARVSGAAFGLLVHFGVE
jgi:hypothetical protein